MIGIFNFERMWQFKEGFPHDFHLTESDELFDSSLLNMFNMCIRHINFVLRSTPEGLAPVVAAHFSLWYFFRFLPKKLCWLCHAYNSSISSCSTISISITVGLMKTVSANINEKIHGVNVNSKNVDSVSANQ